HPICAPSSDIRNLVLAPGTPFNGGDQELTGTPHIYRFPGEAGTVLVAQLSGATAKFALTGSNGQPLRADTADLVSWSGALPQNDTYQLTVTGSGSYKLTLALSAGEAPPSEPPPPPEPERTIQIR
ncbi:MAG: hypothetical protein HC918_00390, partial [Oscillatoriales cyanobacterium SM2_1_8]|nr:hypothetical protein [Oscillatoriales cyanobacterium SM2_1_8]